MTPFRTLLGSQIMSAVSPPRSSRGASSQPGPSAQRYPMIRWRKLTTFARLVLLLASQWACGGRTIEPSVEPDAGHDPYAGPAGSASSGGPASSSPVASPPAPGDATDSGQSADANALVAPPLPPPPPPRPPPPPTPDASAPVCDGPLPNGPSPCCPSAYPIWCNHDLVGFGHCFKYGADCSTVRVCPPETFARTCPPGDYVVCWNTPCFGNNYGGCRFSEPQCQ